MRRFAAFVALVLVSIGIQAAPPSRWTMINLGDLAGGRGSSTPLAVNNRGDVVGYATALVAGGTATHAFLWQNGTMLDLGTPAGATMSDAIDINDHGTVLGGDGLGGQYFWRDGTWTRLTVPGIADRINKFGDIAGAYTAPSGQTHAYLLRDGVLFDTGTLGGAYSIPEALNERGAVVGRSAPAGATQPHAFKWQDGTITDLGTFGGEFSAGIAINNRGVVVGAAWDAARNAFAFIHDGTVMRRLLPDLPPPQTATDINDRGAIVGNLGQNGSYLYDDGVVTRLESIPEVQAGGWARLIPTAMNDRGWITGWGILASGRNAGFVLIPR